MTARLIRWIRRFRGPGDALDFARVGFALLALQVALKAVGLRRVLAYLDPTSPAWLSDPAARHVALRDGRRIAGYADAWLRRLRPRNPCLRRSLLLFGRLRRAGLPVTFCMGIREGQALVADDLIRGHAWLEFDGRVLLESEATAARNLRTFSYP